MRMKLVVSILLVLVVLNLSMFVMGEAKGSRGNNPLDDLMDRTREGLFVGGGVAYGTTRVTVSKDNYKIVEDDELGYLAGGTSGYMRWRIGYATSEHLAFYVTSAFEELQPELGVMAFSEDYPGYYFHALIGYSSADYAVDRIFWEQGRGRNSEVMSFAGGIGYEFRPHFMTEFTLGYSRPSFVARYYDFGGPKDVNFTLNHLTFFASFNYLFY